MIIKTLRKWKAYQDTVRELSSLTRRELNDLGIQPSDIKNVARNASAF